MKRLICQGIFILVFTVCFFGVLMPMLGNTTSMAGEVSILIEIGLSLLYLALLIDFVFRAWKYFESK